MPVSVILNYQDGIYSTDSDSTNTGTNQVLAPMVNLFCLDSLLNFDISIVRVRCWRSI